MKKFSLASLGLLLALVSGCATSATHKHLPRTGDPIIDGKAAIAQGRPEDKVLWQYRTAVAAMRRGQYDEAARLLDDALLSLGGISAGDASARKARGYFNEEASKSFRGEPYERAMAYYYRGILYWMQGEPDNARACFRNAQFHDSDTTDQTYAGDYVLMDYLAGLATEKLAGDGSDVLKRARANSKRDLPPEYNPRANVLVFLEFGRGPVKYATGEFNEQLRFRPGSSAVKGALITVGGQQVRSGIYDDLSYQATTRGGRVMDHILANKAVFKSSTDTAGNVALIGGMAAMHNRRTQEVGLGLVAAGLIGKIISAATTPAADTRSWETLPQYLSFAQLELPPGHHEGTIQFLGPGGQVIKSQQISFEVASGQDTVLFVSDRS